MVFYEEDKEKYQIVPGMRLTEPQLEGIDYVLHKFNCILNLKPGLGKTLTGLVATYEIMKKTHDTVTFIVCPKAANTAFKKELRRMKFLYSILVTEERIIDNKGRYFIFNYSNVDDMEKLARELSGRGFKIIGLFDEIHTLGSSDSNLVARMKAIRGMFTCVIGMTGTPLLNNIEGLFNVVDYVKSGFLGSWWSFKDTWIITKKKNIRRNGRLVSIEEYAGYKNIDDLRDRLKGIIITRGVNYPLRYFYRDCSLTSEERENYEIASRGILNEDSSDEKAMAGRLWDLQRIADGSSKFIDSKMYSKSKLLVSTLKEILDRGEGVLIYTELEDTYRTIGDIIEQYRGYIGYKNLWYITGKTAYKKRVECERDLRARDIVVVTAAGNKAINLQAVNNVIFYDLPFAMGNYVQMCPGVDEEVNTSDGLIKAGDLPSKFKIVRNGRSYEAYRGLRERKELVKITLDNNKQIVVCKGHKFKTSTGGWVCAEESEGCFLERDDSKSFGERITSNDIWYLVGYLLGDGTVNIKIQKTSQGWIKHRNEFRWLVPKCQSGYKDKIIGILDGLGIKYSITKSHSEAIENISVYGTDFREILDSVGYDYTKQIVPDKLMGSTEEEKVSFLIGLYDADGVKKDDDAALHMSSYSLLFSVQLILDSLGIISKLTRNKDYKKYHSSTLRIYSCDIFRRLPKVDRDNIDFSQRQEIYKLCKDRINRSLVDDVYTLNDLKKSSNVSWKRCVKLLRNCGVDYSLVKSQEVVSVEGIGLGECVEITVDSDEHEYLIRGIVSHNCGRVARIDSVYEFQNIYMLEVKDTIDTYKRMLLQSNMTLVQEIFGQDSTMPYYGDIDKDVMKKYRQYFKNKFLWCR